jgi:hypothetical protein
MYRVLSCLTEQHDYRLVLCAVTTFTAFQVFRAPGKAKA